jgi:hypothetical protein
MIIFIFKCKCKWDNFASGGLLWTVTRHQMARVIQISDGASLKTHLLSIARGSFSASPFDTTWERGDSQFYSHCASIIAYVHKKVLLYYKSTSGVRGAINKALIVKRVAFSPLSSTCIR